MKFRFYISSIFNGEVKGTNDEKVAKNMAGSEDDFVVDSETGEWLLSDGTRQPIEELKSNEVYGEEE